MVDLPTSSSFIPKRTEGTRVRRKRTQNFLLLSIISYACLIAAPTGSAAVFVYKLYTEKQFNNVVTELDQAIGGFSEANMARVLEFDKRLTHTETLLDSHISVAKVFDILESNTADNVGFTDLTVSKNEAGGVTVVGNILATNFDAALFQRGAYNDSSVPLEGVRLSGIAFMPVDEAGASEKVQMKGTFDFSQSALEFSPITNTTESATETEVTPGESNSVDETESNIASSTDSSNQNI